MIFLHCLETILTSKSAAEISKENHDEKIIRRKTGRKRKDGRKKRRKKEKKKRKGKFGEKAAK